jgi:hypothetical protein
MLLKTTVGAGISVAGADAKIDYDELIMYDVGTNGSRTESYRIPEDYLDITFTTSENFTYVQGRVDFDWEIGSGFLFASGVHELYNQYKTEWRGKAVTQVQMNGGYVQFPIDAQNEVNNQRFYSSAYVLGEYSSPGNKFGAELGLRMDHLYLKGDGYDIQTIPVLNPRLNLDYNVFKNLGIVESLDLTFGTGLFSSMDTAIAILTPDSIEDLTLKPNRSWTTVAGIKMDFLGGWSINLEGYFKYVYDRAYQYFSLEPGVGNANIVQRFNGDGIVWGFDLMLQKFESRYWDGWLAYTFTDAKYHEPEEPAGLVGGVMQLQDSGWYYPSFHRFHNLNLVLNFKPFRNFNIYTRFGFASGRPMARVGEITEYKIALLDENLMPVYDPDGRPIIITRYRRSSYYDENTRTTWSFPWDLKLSYYISSNRNKVLTEIYLAAENLMSLFYVAKSNTSFNSYTGQEDTGSDSASYEMPLPMVSFGIRWSF